MLFANFAEAMAEGRGKAQAATLRASRTQTTANRLRDNGKTEQVSADQLRKGDVVLIVAGEAIPGDGEIIEGAATVDESAITGESAPVIREAGGDRSSVTGGTRVLSDEIKVRISANPGESFLDRMIGWSKARNARKRPNEIALTILLSALTIIFLLVCMTLLPFGKFSGVDFSPTVLIALLVCLIPTTIGGLLSAIGIAGIDRLVQKNVLAMSGRAVEAAGDVDVLLLDKTGTITLGNRQAVSSSPRRASARTNWPTPRSFPAWRTRRRKAAPSSCSPNNRKACAGANSRSCPTPSSCPFTAQTRMSGVNLDGQQFRKGAADSVRAYVGGKFARRGRCRRDRIFPAREARRWSWPRGKNRWASSTSRTSSRVGWRTASSGSARWASRP